MKVTDSVKKETMNVAGLTCIASAVMVLVFVIIGKFNPPVLWGALLGCAVGTANFFFLGLTVQKAVDADSDTQAKTMFHTSYMVRNLLQAGFMVLGILSPWFNWVATILPIIFANLSVRVLSAYNNRKEQGES